jgi:predicted regulator of Ras-like GTPase activity (Roadblock/LC7/MglB family)
MVIVMTFKYGTEIGLDEGDIDKLEPEIAFVTENTEVESIALTTAEGFQIAFAAVPGYHLDSDAFCGIASALVMTGRSTIMSVFQKDLDEIIVRAEDGYVVVSNAGRFVLVGASRLINSMMQTVKIFRQAATRIEQNFPSSR